MKYTNGTDSVFAVHWLGKGSERELMEFVDEDFLGMMGSNGKMDVFVDLDEDVTEILHEGEYLVEIGEKEFKILTEEKFKKEYPDYNTIIIQIRR